MSALPPQALPQSGATTIACDDDRKLALESDLLLLREVFRQRPYAAPTNRGCLPVWNEVAVALQTRDHIAITTKMCHDRFLFLVAQVRKTNGKAKGKIAHLGPEAMELLRRTSTALARYQKRDAALPTQALETTSAATQGPQAVEHEPSAPSPEPSASLVSNHPLQQDQRSTTTTAVLKAVQQPASAQPKVPQKVAASAKTSGPKQLSSVDAVSLSLEDVLEMASTPDEAPRFSETDDTLLLLAVARLRPYSGHPNDQASKWQSIANRLSSSSYSNDHVTAGACRARCLQLLREVDINAAADRVESTTDSVEAGQNRIKLLKVIRRDIQQEVEGLNRPVNMVVSVPPVTVDAGMAPETERLGGGETTSQEERVRSTSAKRKVMEAIAAHLASTKRTSVYDGALEPVPKCISGRNGSDLDSEAVQIDDDESDDGDFIIAVSTRVMQAGQPKGQEPKETMPSTEPPLQAQSLPPSPPQELAAEANPEPDTIQVHEPTAQEEGPTPVSAASSPTANQSDHAAPAQLPPSSAGTTETAGAACVEPNLGRIPPTVQETPGDAVLSSQSRRGRKKRPRPAASNDVNVEETVDREAHGNDGGDEESITNNRNKRPRAQSTGEARPEPAEARITAASSDEPHPRANPLTFEGVFERLVQLECSRLEEVRSQRQMMQRLALLDRDRQERDRRHRDVALQAILETLAKEREERKAEMSGMLEVLNRERQERRREFVAMINLVRRAMDDNPNRRLDDGEV